MTRTRRRGHISQLVREPLGIPQELENVEGEGESGSTCCRRDTSGGKRKGG